MSEWGLEEDLLAFGRQCEGLLGEEGLRRSKVERQWLDVLENAPKT